MKTYYLLDTDTNTWSPEPLPLKDIMAMSGVTGSTMLADAQTRITLTVSAAVAASHKPRLKSPTKPLLRMDGTTRSASGGNTAASAPAHRKAHRSEYKVLDRQAPCFGGNFCAYALEQALNTYARQGWRVRSCMMPGSSAAADAAPGEFFIVMERKVSLAQH